MLSADSKKYGEIINYAEKNTDWGIKFDCK